jgi:hypothetical protein
MIVTKFGRLNKNGEINEMTLEENKTRLFRVANRCKKQKHTPITNDFGVTWCKDCGTLIQKF